MRKSKDQQPAEEVETVEQEIDTSVPADGDASGTETSGADDTAGAETGNGETEETEDTGGQAKDEAVDTAAKLAELSDKYVRLAAEYDNFRRRSKQEKDLLYEQSVTDVVTEWLPVVDNLQRALDASAVVDSPEINAIEAGIEKVMQQAKSVLTKLNVEEIDCMGKTFDPHVASAVVHVDDEAYGENEVIEVLQKGYIRGETVIRHAIVRVAN